MKDGGAYAAFRHDLWIHSDPRSRQSVALTSFFHEGKFSMCRNVVAVFMLCVLSIGTTASTAQAVTLTIADYQDDFQPTTPAAGWSYKTNGNGTFGTEANYTNMV